MHILELEGRREQSDSEFTRLQVSRQAEAGPGRRCSPAHGGRRAVAAAAALTDSARARDSDRDSQALRLYESGCQWQVTVTGIVTAGALPAH